MSLSEDPFLFGDPHPLFGIVTRKEDAPPRKTGMVILSSGLVHRAGPFGLGVALSRGIAAEGFPVLRFDQSSRGDSDRRKNVSVSEAANLDIDLAKTEIRERTGVERVVLVGLCSGADDILRYAATVNDLHGYILLDPLAERDGRYKLRVTLSRLSKLHHWPHYASKLLRKSPKSAADVYMGAIREFPTREDASRAFQNAAENDGAALAVFSGGVSDYYNYRGQMISSLGLAKMGRAIEEHFLPEAEHTYPLSFHRQKLIDIVTEFCNRRFN